MRNRIAVAALFATCLSHPAFAQAETPATSAGGDMAQVPSADILHASDVSAAIRAEAALQRIAALDDAGPMLNAVIVTNPDAPALAEAAAGTLLGGATVLVKDNIETAEWPTTAGSLALAGNMTGRDAPLIARLRAAGGVVLGKTNLSEWANIRSSNSTSGWSAVGGLTRNPHAIDRNSCGSSSGSGAAVAAGLAWAAIGTETDGSITCPASINGIVGFKPTVGLVSRTHVVPISASQDTAGPMAASVRDAALLLTAIAGGDPADTATAEADVHVMNFTQGLGSASLLGRRIGVMRTQVGNNSKVTALFDQALRDMEAAGAVLVDIEYQPDDAMWGAEFTVLMHEFRTGIADYLSASPADLPARDLAGLIAFNEEHAAEEMRWFAQETFLRSEATTDDAAYDEARATAHRLAGPQGIDRLLAEHDVEVLVAPTTGPAWATDLVMGDNYQGGIGAGSLAAVAGYPHLTVPMGAVEGLPVGISFIGTAWDDHHVLTVGAAYETARSVAAPRPGFTVWTPE